MKALLMHPDRDFDPKFESLRRERASRWDRDSEPLPEPTKHERALLKDLELETLLRAMARGDQFFLDVSWKALISGVENDVGTILYRQEVLKDCIKNRAIVQELYDLTVEAIRRKRKTYFGFFANKPSSILHGSLEVLQTFIVMLRKLKSIAEVRAGDFGSKAFQALFTMLRTELGDEYLAEVDGHLRDLKFGAGILFSAVLGRGNEGIDYVLRRPLGKRPSWLQQIFGNGRSALTFHIATRDEAGARALSELQDRSINLVANALAQSMDHIQGFFDTLRTELAFYLAALNLRDKLAVIGVEICMPEPQASGTRHHRFRGLSDICLALDLERSVVPNSTDATDKNLIIISGANQGGKSTFLRSIGVAQLMMQCGLFVAAESFSANTCTGLFTHYKREEDSTMKSGKLDEELARLSEIADSIAPNAMVLFNESFASTNEREGSEIARQIVSALLERNIKVFFVTHLFGFAHGFFDEKRADAAFLQPERRDDGTRTFRLVAGEPLETSYGEDLYREVFATDTERRSTG